MLTDIFSNYVTVLFGYVVAIYFGGPYLSKFQFLILNFLYLTSMLTLAFAYWGAHSMGIRHFEQLLKLDPTIPPQLMWTDGMVGYNLVFQIVILSASLSFGWTARNPKAAQSS